VPRLAGTAKLRPFEAPNSVLSHTRVTTSDKWLVTLPDPGASRVLPSSVGTTSQVQLAAGPIFDGVRLRQLGTISVILTHAK
jgi:hypothetical protein